MPHALAGPQELATTIMARIRARTHGQVRDLRVELDGPVVVIGGLARTHYARQLAEHGATDLIDDRTIINRIVVV